MNPFVQRMIRAAKLDASLYEEVEAKKELMPEAMGVVVLSALAAGLGGAARGVGGLVAGLLWGVFGWLLFSLIVYYLGTRWFADEKTEADYGQLLRTLGFAASPGIIRILGVIKPLWWLSFLVAGVWMIPTSVMAVRQALDYSSTSRAAVVCILGLVVWWLAALVLGALGCRLMP